MPSTPTSGQISFSDVKSLTTDKLGYIPPTNITIGELAAVVRQFGQKGPNATNLAFSNFYQSTIAGYTILTTSETFQNYYAALNNGVIQITFRSKTFKKTPDATKYYIKATTQLAGDSINDQEVKLIDWTDTTTDNFITFNNQDSGSYTVDVTDLTTGALIGSSTAVVQYNGGNTTYFINA
jgi:hypothetical protein